MAARANPVLKSAASLLVSRAVTHTRIQLARPSFRSLFATPFSIAPLARRDGNFLGGRILVQALASSHRPFCAEAEPAALKESPPELRLQILDAALNHVHQWGWTAQAIAAGASDQGLSVYSHGLFPRGAIELVEHFQQKCEKEWVEELAKIDTSGQTTHEKLSVALRLRLAKQGAFMSTWPQALALQALPHHAPGAMATLAKISDIAWTHAGDRRKDVASYSKRAVLGGIYTGTELYMLTDYSENFSDTFDFLDRQLKEIERLGTTVELAGQQIEQLMSAGLSSLQGHKDANRP